MRRLGKDKGLGVPVQKPKKPDHEYFLALLRKGTPKKKAKTLAGFSPSTKTKAILAAKKTMAAVKSREEAEVVLDARKFSTPQQAREVLSQEPGHRFQDNANKLVELRDDECIPPSVSLGAIKEHNLMMGNNAPIKQQIESKSMTVELSGLTVEQMKYIQENGVEL